MPDRNIPGVLGRSIGRRADISVARRDRSALCGRAATGYRVARRACRPGFNHPSRGPFDGKYMQALYEFGVAAGKKGTAFEETLPDNSLRGSNAQ